jgi:hypothetical protein
MINQGESTQAINAFLKSEGLELEHVLLDPSSAMMREVGSRGLPTTLFFDAEGKMLDAHMGEIHAKPEKHPEKPLWIAVTTNHISSERVLMMGVGSKNTVACCNMMLSPKYRVAQ